MPYYHTCPLCGAHLDPCEVCDCREEKAPPRASTGPERQEKPLHTESISLSARENKEDNDVIAGQPSRNLLRNQSRKARRAPEPVPVFHTDAWGWTPEACLTFPSPATRKAVMAVFHTLDRETQHQLTFLPKPGEWIPRVLFWREALRDLPQAQRSEALLTILHWCVGAKNGRIQRERERLLSEN